MIEQTVTEMYRADDENQFLEVTYQNGDKETLYFKDFSSGAMIENIVRRGKKLAIKRAIEGEGRGIRMADMLESIKQEYKENEDLPNTTNPDDWAKISGKKGERIVYVRTLMDQGDEDAWWSCDRTRRDRPVPLSSTVRGRRDLRIGAVQQQGSAGGVASEHGDHQGLRHRDRVRHPCRRRRAT